MFLTVIIRVYNRENTIEKCLMSVLNQTMIDNIQILIIDDCSDDNSLDVIHKLVCTYPDKHWTIVRHEKNMGRGKALNTAKQYIEGKYCCILDSDDMYNRNTWVEDLYNELGDNEYDIIYNGNPHAFHWHNIYLSEIFKICPICNINYYEDHYTRWFFNNEKVKKYIYNIKHFYSYNSEHEGVNMEEYYTNNKKFANTVLQNLYGDVFFHRKEHDTDELICRFNELNMYELDDVLLESYNEIKQELKL